jgi:hypothetical protein
VQVREASQHLSVKADSNPGSRKAGKPLEPVLEIVANSRQIGGKMKLTLQLAIKNGFLGYPVRQIGDRK